MLKKCTFIGSAMFYSGVSFAFPNSSYIKDQLPKELCFTLNTRVERLDPSRYFLEENTTPICLNLEHFLQNSPLDCAANSTQGGGPKLACTFRQSTTPLASVNTTNLSFYTKIEADTVNSSLSAEPLTRRKDGNMRLKFSLTITSNWDYRFSQILDSKKEDLLPGIDTILLPPVQTGSGSQIKIFLEQKFSYTHESWETKTATTSLKPITAIGFDQSNDEYSIDISIK